MSDAALEQILRRDRAIVLAALVGLAGLAWAYVLWLAADMDMGGMDMTGFRMIPAGVGIMTPAIAPWSAFEFSLVFLMWAVMMVGMMTPAVTPMVLIHARVGRQAAARRAPFPPTAWFVLGYLSLWVLFALAAAGAQWAFERASLLTPTMEPATDVLAGIILVVAGLYQWTAVNDVCLAQCQAPLAFIHSHGGFRPDAAGAVWLGIRHGAYCVGCCWALMTLLFAFGVMNILWIAGLSAFALLQRVIPGGRLLARATGIAMLAGGVWLLAGALQQP
jgi:predicted metal-binding membrane protein